MPLGRLSPLMALVVMLPLSEADFRQVGDSTCDCYLTNGTSTEFFAAHQFFDFRSLSQYAGVPALIQDALNSSQAMATSDYFLSQDWNKAWESQTWNNSALIGQDDQGSTVLAVYSPNNVYLEKNRDSVPSSDTFLTLRTARLKDFQSTAEIASQILDYQFLSVRMLARTVGAPGAVTAMFTYKGADALAQVQESDLEIRTGDPYNRVQLTNQPSYSDNGTEIPAATRNVSMPGNLRWSDWAVHRMDWTPASTTWYIDGQDVASISFQTPREPSQILFNSWSDGGYWSGNMSVATEAHLNIQWIEVVYNSTSASSTTKPRHKRGSYGSPKRLRRGTNGGCNNICSIDETTKTGTPVLIQGSTAPGRLVEELGNLGRSMLWIPAIATMVVLSCW